MPEMPQHACMSFIIREKKREIAANYATVRKLEKNEVHIFVT